MAQFDVYANPSESAAHGIPYVVVVQSDLLDALATRIKEVTTSVTFKNTKHAKLNFVFKVLLSWYVSS